MAKTKKDWYPDGRQNQLNLSRRWLSVLAEPADSGATGSGAKQKWQAWGIPEETFSRYGAAYAKAQETLQKVIISGSRGGPFNAAVNAAFRELETQSRDLKRRYFLSPPLTSVDFDALDLKEPDTSRTPAPTPRHSPQVKLSNTDLHEILLTLTQASDEDVSSFGFNIRLGILAPDGVIPERTSTAPYYMTKAPSIPEDLPGQFNRRRKHESFPLTAADAGKTVYFCVCYQNAKGDCGPWSEIMTAIIT